MKENDLFYRAKKEYRDGGENTKDRRGGLCIVLCIRTSQEQFCWKWYPGRLVSPGIICFYLTLLLASKRLFLALRQFKLINWKIFVRHYSNLHWIVKKAVFYKCLFACKTNSSSIILLYEQTLFPGICIVVNLLEEIRLQVK